MGALPLKRERVSAKATPGGQVTKSPDAMSVNSPLTVVKIGSERITSSPSPDAAKPRVRTR